MLERFAVALVASGLVLAPRLAAAQPAPEAPPGPAAPEAEEEVGEERTDPPDDEPEPPADDEPPASEPEEPDPADDADHPLPGAAPRPALPRGPATPPGAGRAPTAPSPAATEAEASPQRRQSPDDPVPLGREVLAEDWWTRARPIIEIHGYFRVRPELFHKFSLGRMDPPNAAIWPHPADNHYTATDGAEYGPRLCTPSEAGTGGSDSLQNLGPCQNNTNAGANMRFRLNPEIHVSDNLRILSQIDILDNQVLGSTPGGHLFMPSADGGFETVSRSGYHPVGALEQTVAPPRSGVNSLSDSIQVKRVWGEYTTPVGELRFGRMPDHWGLGIVRNSGDQFDDDFQTDIDRLMFVTGLKPLDLYFAAAWDFPNEGPTLGRVQRPGDIRYDAAQLDDVNQWALIVARKMSPELTRLALARDQVVLNGGLYLTHRKQLLANDQQMATRATGANVPDATPADLTAGYTRRGASMWVPDAWLQLRYRKFRFEVEAAAVLGSVDSLQTAPGEADDIEQERRRLRQYGVATEIEQRLVEDRLRLQFRTGWASGDASTFDPGTVGDLAPGPNELQINDDTISTFRFHPAYRVDLILHRFLLTRVQGTYYLSPSVEYDFMRQASGQRLGGGAGVIWTRASEFVQTPGHARDLGIELNGTVYFQSKDGTLNDEPGQMGGFYTMLQYGVLFPLAGLGYQDADRAEFGDAASTSAAQIVRWYLGVLF